VFKLLRLVSDTAALHPNQATAEKFPGLTAGAGRSALRNPKSDPESDGIITKIVTRPWVCIPFV
jgi:hypothetical protein